MCSLAFQPSTSGMSRRARFRASQSVPAPCRIEPAVSQGHPDLGHVIAHERGSIMASFYMAVRPSPRAAPLLRSARDRHRAKPSPAAGLEPVSAGRNNEMLPWLISRSSMASKRRWRRASPTSSSPDAVRTRSKTTDVSVVDRSSRRAANANSSPRSARFQPDQLRVRGRASRPGRRCSSRASWSATSRSRDPGDVSRRGPAGDQTTDRRLPSSAGGAGGRTVDPDEVELWHRRRGGGDQLGRAYMSA